jgi:hypothetical protein
LPSVFLLEHGKTLPCVFYTYSAKTSRLTADWTETKGHVATCLPSVLYLSSWCKSMYLDLLPRNIPSSAMWDITYCMRQAHVAGGQAVRYSLEIGKGNITMD